LMFVVFPVNQLPTDLCSTGVDCLIFYPAMELLWTWIFHTQVL
jgi:hypothetical protein